jgi:hypothetical protein
MPDWVVERVPTSGQGVPDVRTIGQARGFVKREHLAI